MNAAADAQQVLKLRIEMIMEVKSPGSLEQLPRLTAKWAGRELTWYLLVSLFLCVCVSVRVCVHVCVHVSYVVV